MTKDEALELFSEAYDGELSQAQQEAFDALIASDEDLLQEWSEFRAILDETRNLFGATGGSVEVPAPDLLGNVQAKLRARSRGRFYRDRFAENSRPSLMMPTVVAMAILAIVGIAWLALNYVQFAS